MTLHEAMSQRHTVRKFTSDPITEDQTRLLYAKLDELNQAHNLMLQLVMEDTSGVNAFARMFMSSGARNFFVLAAKPEEGYEERLGYAGAELCLYVQTLGLNTWWIGGTYSMRHVGSLAPDAKVIGIIVVGHGATQGVPHKSRTAEQVSSYNGEAPEWFKAGVEAALLAPTALNRQKFMVKGDGRKVSLKYAPGPMAGTDQGIVKYHFELGAGRENFEWAD